jgi:hypothetical protein
LDGLDGVAEEADTPSLVPEALPVFPGANGPGSAMPGVEPPDVEPPDVEPVDDEPADIEPLDDELDDEAADGSDVLVDEAQPLA